ncbi:lactate dehydrogenase [Fournierella massiliensis]|nr:lactate dehydrogenase [Fournierella massiliensis]MCF2556889.1 lactate dehydrogenase [Fournierella massiliensis]
MYYYLVEGAVCCSFTQYRDLEPLSQPQKPEVYLFEGDPRRCRASFALTQPGLLTAGPESVAWLDRNSCPEPAQLDEPVREAFRQGGLRAVNRLCPDWKKLLRPSYKTGKKRLNLLAMGDVGGTLLTGLRLLGSDVIESIGICDLNEKAAARWEFEANQIAYPWEYDALPPVEIISPEEFFRCDAAVFIASRSIPPVGSQVQDVRMAQFEANRKIVAGYAHQARREGFGGLFCQVSDPVDPLARVMFEESNRDEEGRWDGKGLRPEQIQGFGLGVMNARAAYYAKKEEKFASFLTQGRAFGPHGEDLVIANSLEAYDPALSDELTQKAVRANLEMRALGYKPYVAPAFSSGALSLLLTLRGQWHYGSVFLGGVYMGCKNRYTPLGLETELAPLPAPLLARIRKAADHLASLAQPLE